MMTFRFRYSATLPLVALAVVGVPLLAGCGGEARLGSFVAPHLFVIYPTNLTLAPGATHVVTVDNSGDSGTNFTTDWSIQEGAVGGTLSTPRTLGTTSEVTYTAPATPGHYHVVAADHSDPSHFSAVCDVTVTP